MKAIKQAIVCFANKAKREGIIELIEKSKDLKYEIDGKDVSAFVRCYIIATARELEKEGKL